MPVLTEWQSPCILSLVSCSPCCSLVIVGCQLCNEDFTVCCLGISLETCPAYVLRLISGYALRSCSSLFFFFKIRSASVQLFNAFLSSLFVTCLLQSHVQDAQMWSAEGRLGYFKAIGTFFSKVNKRDASFLFWITKHKIVFMLKYPRKKKLCTARVNGVGRHLAW